MQYTWSEATQIFMEMPNHIQARMRAEAIEELESECEGGDIGTSDVANIVIPRIIYGDYDTSSQ